MGELLDVAWMQGGNDKWMIAGGQGKMTGGWLRLSDMSQAEIIASLSVVGGLGEGMVLEGLVEGGGERGVLQMDKRQLARSLLWATPGGGGASRGDRARHVVRIKTPYSSNDGATDSSLGANRLG